MNGTVRGMQEQEKAHPVAMLIRTALPIRITRWRESIRFRIVLQHISSQFYYSKVLVVGL